MTQGLQWWHHQCNEATAQREQRRVRQFGLHPVVSDPRTDGELPGEVWAWQVPPPRSESSGPEIAPPVRVGFAGNYPHTGHLGLARAASELAGHDGTILVFDVSGDRDQRMVDAFRAALDYFATGTPEVRVVGDDPDVRHLQRQAARALPWDRVRRIYGFDSTTHLASALDVADMLAFFLFTPDGIDGAGVALVDAPQASHSAAVSHVGRALGMTPPGLLYRRLFPHLRRAGERGSAREAASVMFLDDDEDTVRTKFGRAITGGRPTAAEQRAYGGDPTRCSAFATVELLSSPQRARTTLAECRAGEVTCSECKEKNADAVVAGMHAITDRLTHRAGTSPDVGPALQRTVRTLHRPPPRECDALEAAIATRAGTRTDQVVAGNGSTEVMDWLFRLQAQPGTQVVAIEPAFELYRDLARRHGLAYMPVSWDSATFAPDLTELGRAIGESTALVVVELPHSVSGAAVSLDSVIERVVPRLPTGARLLLDLAYADFMDSPPRLSADLIEAHPEIVAFGTLSKAHCLLGARVGYALTATVTTAKRLRQQRLPYALDTLATAAAGASLADAAHVERTLQANRTARARLTAVLDERDIAYVPSQANFQLVNLAGWYQPVVDRLRARNARYRDGHRWELAGWIQVHLIDVPTVTPVIEAIEDVVPGRP